MKDALKNPKKVLISLAHTNSRSVNWKYFKLVFSPSQSGTVTGISVPFLAETAETVVRLRYL